MNINNNVCMYNKRESETKRLLYRMVQDRTSITLSVFLHTMRLVNYYFASEMSQNYSFFSFRPFSAKKTTQYN